MWLNNEIDRANRWLKQDAFPLWFTEGVDYVNGGFHDSLDLNGRPHVGPKRLRVACRQIYVASIAAELGVNRSSDIIQHGVDFIFNFAELESGAYLSYFDEFGTANSQEVDTYDLAFVVFALACAYRVKREPIFLEKASNLLSFLQTFLTLPSGGFSEGIPAKLPRRQNPHMHLLEACIEWMLLIDNSAFHKQADELVNLFNDKFFHVDSGTVVEYFDNDLNFLQVKGSLISEPGHVFEWCWLLQRYAKITGYCNTDLPRMLQSGRRLGVASNGLLYGEVSENGSVLSDDVRLWPHAEWVRAEIVMASTSDDDSGIRLALSALWRFLDTDKSGLWREYYSYAEKDFKNTLVPSTSFYHIVGAFHALIKLNDERKHGAGLV